MRATPSQCYFDKNKRAVLLGWYRIRDMLFEDNFVTHHDPLGALQLAAACEHPDAQWLTKLFYDHDVKCREEMRDIFVAQGDDARALCFAALIVTDDLEDEDKLYRSAELGFAYAQSLVAERSKRRDGFRLAEKSAAQGERNGFYTLGICYKNGYGCEVDIAKTKKNYLLAIELGCVIAMVDYGLLFDIADVQRYVWLGRAAVRGCCYFFLAAMVEQIGRFNDGKGKTAVIFAIGCVLEFEVNVAKGKIFEKEEIFDSNIGPANQAIGFYKSQTLAARRAVHSWTLVAKRNFIAKDVRLIVARMIWDARCDGKYQLW